MELAVSFIELLFYWQMFTVVDHILYLKNNKIGRIYLSFKNNVQNKFAMSLICQHKIV